MELPFPDYIAHPEHEWLVCIGVPYGTHIWLVAASKQMNGSFLMAFAQARKECFLAKPFDKKSFYPSADIIPSINTARPQSFGNVDWKCL
jgi:hypothetical protein